MLMLQLVELFMDPVYDSFPGSAFGDLTGTTPSNIPDETITSSITWNWNMNGWDGYFRLSHLIQVRLYFLKILPDNHLLNLKEMVSEKWIH